MYELNIRFKGDSVAEQALRKNLLINLLKSHGISDYVDAFIDGITDQADELTHDTLLSGTAPDHWPVTLYRSDRCEIDGLSNLILSTDLLGITIAIRELPDELWQNAWFRDGDVITWETPPLNFLCVSESQRLPRQLNLDHTLYIVANQAFGDGRHHATTTMLNLLVRNLHAQTSLNQKTLLDIGTGTGIIALAALKLGIGKATGTDISPEIVAAAKANASRNQLNFRVTVEADPERIPGLYSIVCANILAPVLHDLMPSFAVKLAPKGQLFLSGFTISDSDLIIAKARESNLLCLETVNESGWLCLRFEKI